MRGKQIETSADCGELIKRRRKQLGYTQEEIAQFTGLSPRLIGELEHGKDSAGISKYLMVAQGLGIDLFAKVRGE